MLQSIPKPADKTCSRCKTVRLVTDYQKDKNRKDGLYPQCRMCVNGDYNSERGILKARKWRYARKYGITIEEFDAMFAAQSGRCALCNMHHSELSKTFAVDHDHTTGKVRGLLCINCNLGLGKFKDSPELLQLAIEYLGKY